MHSPIPCSLPAAQHRQPPPSWQPAPGRAGSPMITHGAALPNTYSAAGRIPPPSCCSPSPPRSQPPPGPAPSPKKRSSGARAPRPARLLQPKESFGRQKTNWPGPSLGPVPVFALAQPAAWQSALQTVVTQCQVHQGTCGVRSLPVRPEQTPRCRLCLSTFLKDCSGAWSRKLGLKNSQKAGKTFLRGLKLTGRPRSCVLGALATSHQGALLIPWPRSSSSWVLPTNPAGIRPARGRHRAPSLTKQLKGTPKSPYGRRGGVGVPADGRSPQTPGQSSARWDFPEAIQ